MDPGRRYQRFNIDIMNVTGKIVWSHIVTIKTVTEDVVVLSTDARMNLDRKYILHIEDQDESINVGGTVTASAIDASTLSPEGETTPLYLAELRFDKSTSLKREHIRRFTALLTREDRPDLSRLKLWVDIPGETNTVTETYRVKEIGIGGMRIECPNPHEVGCTFRILMSLPDIASLRIRAKVVWCIQSGELPGGHCDLGFTFTDMSETDWRQLETFIRHLQQPQEADADFWRHEKI